jgi:putative thioredoxin
VTQPSLNVQGAIDLAALAKAREATARPAALSGDANAFVKDVTATSFEADVLTQSMTVPVIVDLWAEWCAPCKALSPIMEKLAAEYGGAFILAKIDIEAEQQLAAAFQVQSIPMVLAFVAGQPLGLFQEALPEPQVREVIEQVLAAAKSAGVVGIADGSTGSPGEPEVVSDPRFDAAEAALEAGDWTAAVTAYQEVLKATPNDAIAKIGLLNVELLQRTDGVDFDEVLALTGTDVETQLQIADIEFLCNEYAHAFERLISVIRDDVNSRPVVRERLLQLFDIAGPTDPAVVKARVALSNALF